MEISINMKRRHELFRWTSINNTILGINCIMYISTYNYPKYSDRMSKIQWYFVRFIKNQTFLKEVLKDVNIENVFT